MAQTAAAKKKAHISFNEKSDEIVPDPELYGNKLPSGLSASMTFQNARSKVINGDDESEEEELADALPHADSVDVARLHKNKKAMKPVAYSATRRIQGTESSSADGSTDTAFNKRYKKRLEKNRDSGDVQVRKASISDDEEDGSDYELSRERLDKQKVLSNSIELSGSDDDDNQDGDKNNQSEDEEDGDVNDSHTLLKRRYKKKLVETEFIRKSLDSLPSVGSNSKKQDPSQIVDSVSLMRQKQVEKEIELLELRKSLTDLAASTEPASAKSVERENSTATQEGDEKDIEESFFDSRTIMRRKQLGL